MLGIATIVAAAATLADPGAASEPGSALLQATPEAIEAWKDMRFGMFLCWGPVSLTGKEIGWSRGSPPWGRRPGVRGGRGPTLVEVYDNLYKKWKPERFDARAWVQVAKDAGMKYLIFLVKHHDGFSLFDTKLSDYKITGPESAWKVDVMKAVAEACHEADLELFIYYSQPDWHHPDYLGPHHERYVEYLHGQVRELLTNYGRIDGLWFDNLRPVGPETAKLWDAEKLFRMARGIQPHLVINNRCGLPGDFDTPEQHIGHFQADRPWESCCTLGTQWAWKPDDRIKPLGECVQMLVGCAIGDGNLALNTNPMPDGRIEPRQAERFREIGRWTERYGESIYGTRGGPFVAPGSSTARWQTRDGFRLPGGRWWGGSTYKGDTAYLHVLRWPDETIELPSPGFKVVEHAVLTGGEAAVEQDDQGIRVTVPADQRDPLDTIVKLRFDRTLEGVGPVRARSGSLCVGGKATASGVWPEPHLPAAFAIDDDLATRWGAEPDSRSGWLEVDLGEPKTFGRLGISEAYDRVRRFELEVEKDGRWQTVYRGTTVGEDFSAEFKPVTARHVRLNIIEATHVPTIWEFQLFEPEK